MLNVASRTPHQQNGTLLDGDPLLGTRYRAVSMLAEGGGGQVWVARHCELGREVIVKLLREELRGIPGLVDRMRFEAQILGQLRHPNVVDVLDCGQTPEGRPFIVMERLTGRTLREELKLRGKFPVLESIALVSQVLDALEASHALGIAHRDIKLDNIFLERIGAESVRVKVLDFGIAKRLPSASEQAPFAVSVPTAQGIVLGTPRFLSPEAALGMTVDQRSDLYAVGLVLYELVAGRGPWGELKRADDLLRANVETEPPPPSALASQEIPRELDAAILRALRKRPGDRYQSASEMRTQLAALATRAPVPIASLASSAPTVSAAYLGEQRADRGASQTPGPAAVVQPRGKAPTRGQGSGRRARSEWAAMALLFGAVVLLTAGLIVAIIW